MLPTTIDQFEPFSVWEKTSIATGEHTVVFIHNNAPSNTAKPIRDTLEAPHWEVLLHVVNSPDLALSDYHLFASVSHALAVQRFGSSKDVKKWFEEYELIREYSIYENTIVFLLSYVLFTNKLCETRLRCTVIRFLNISCIYLWDLCYWVRDLLCYFV